jgi:CRP-like cAMP-binding protein
MIEANLTLLYGTGFFKGLQPADLEVVLSQSREQVFETGSFIFYQDDPAERIYVLKSGRVKLMQLSEDG